MLTVEDRELRDEVATLLRQAGTTSESHTTQASFSRLNELRGAMVAFLNRVLRAQKEISPRELIEVITMVSLFANFLSFEHGAYSLTIPVLSQLKKIEGASPQATCLVLSTLARLHADRYEHFHEYRDITSAEAYHQEYEKKSEEAEKWKYGNSHGLARVLIFKLFYLRESGTVRNIQDTDTYRECERRLAEVMKFREQRFDGETADDETDRVRRLGNTFVERALLYLIVDDHDSAKRMLTRAMDIVCKMPSNIRWIEEAWCLHRLGHLYEARKNPLKAFESYYAAIELLNSNRPPNHLHPRVADIVFDINWVLNKYHGEKWYKQEEDKFFKVVRLVIPRLPSERSQRTEWQEAQHERYQKWLDATRVEQRFPVKQPCGFNFW